jgi:hypothetical protein
MKVFLCSTILVILMISLSSCVSARYPNPPTPAQLYGEISGVAHFPTEMQKWKFPENILVVLNTKGEVLIVLHCRSYWTEDLMAKLDPKQTYVFKYHKIANQLGPPDILTIKDKAEKIIYSEEKGIHNKPDAGDGK